MAKNDTRFDEEIIDLTELIEPGEKGAGKAANAYAKAAASTDDTDADDDFASILAETTGNLPKQADSQDPLDMSDMGGIDNLLESLDIPAQPHERKGAGGEVTQASDDELDSVLDDLLGSDKPASAKTAPTPQKPEKDALDSDLDDILSSFDEPAPAKAKTSKSVSEPAAHDDLLNADLDDILADVEQHGDAAKAALKSGGTDDPEALVNEQVPKSTSNTTVASAPDLEDDLDALLNDSPRKPAPKAAPKSDIDDDLDSLLNESAPKPVPSAAVASAPDLEDDLDALLNGPVPNPDSAPAARPASKPVSNARPDLGIADDLLDETAPKPAPRTVPRAAPKPAARPASKPAPDATPDLNLAEDLDDILNEPAPKAAPKPAARPVAKPAPESVDNFDLPDDLDSALDGHAPNATKTVPQQSYTLPAEVPGSQTLPAQQPWSPDAFAAICRNIAAGGAQETLQEFSRELGSQTAHVQDMVSQITQLSKRVLASESKLSAARARIAALEKGIESATALEDLLKDGTPLHAGFMTLISSAVANAIKNVPIAAPADNGVLKDEVTKLRQNFENMASRLAALETRVNSYVDSASNETSGLKKDMEKLDANFWNADVRLGQLEQRMVELSDSKVMEKAAAATVARVLHEEISRLAQS